MTILAKLHDHEPLQAPPERRAEVREKREFEVIECEPALKPNSSVHRAVFASLAMIYAALLAVFWLTFQGAAEALFMVAISAVYLAAYVGTPYMLSRVGGHIDPVQDKTLDVFLREPFETWTGIVAGWEAALQILLIPAAVLIAGAGMGVIIAIAR